MGRPFLKPHGICRVKEATTQESRVTRHVSEPLTRKCMPNAYILRCEIAYRSGGCAYSVTSSPTSSPSCRCRVTRDVNHVANRGRSWRSDGYFTANEGCRRRNIFRKTSLSFHRAVFAAMYSLHKVGCQEIVVTIGALTYVFRYAQMDLQSATVSPLTCACQRECQLEHLIQHRLTYGSLSRWTCGRTLHGTTIYINDAGR
jgi:hypothetical protein